MDRLEPRDASTRRRGRRGSNSAATLGDTRAVEPLDADRERLGRLPAQWLVAFGWRDDHGDAFWAE